MEKNREILDKVLQQMRSYTPDEKVWDAVQSQMPGATLADGLSKLKSIDSPEIVWDAIANELDKLEKINQLKQFTPGDEVWGNILETINKEDGVQSAEFPLRGLRGNEGAGLPFRGSRGSEGKFGKKRFFRVSLFRISSWAAAAAILVLMGYFLIFQNASSENITYSQEIIETGNATSWQDEDTEILDVLRELCTSNPMACSSPAFKEKEKELFYLNTQKSEILDNLNAYDNNKQLEVLLTKIELEKNDLVKQMISEIL